MWLLFCWSSAPVVFHFVCLYMGQMLGSEIAAGSALCLSPRWGVAPGPLKPACAREGPWASLQTQRTHSLSAGLLVSCEGRGWTWRKSGNSSSMSASEAGTLRSHGYT